MEVEDDGHLILRDRNDVIRSYAFKEVEALPVKAPPVTAKGRDTLPLRGGKVMKKPFKQNERLSE